MHDQARRFSAVGRWAMIEFRNVSKSYDDGTLAVSDLSLTAASYEWMVPLAGSDPPLPDTPGELLEH